MSSLGSILTHTQMGGSTLTPRKPIQATHQDPSAPSPILRDPLGAEDGEAGKLQALQENVRVDLPRGTNPLGHWGLCLSHRQIGIN